MHRKVFSVGITKLCANGKAKLFKLRRGFILVKAIDIPDWLKKLPCLVPTLWMCSVKMNLRPLWYNSTFLV